MPSRFDYKCPKCEMIYADIKADVGNPPDMICWRDMTPLRRYFGNYKSLMINYGYREGMHGDIEKFQFTHLNDH